MTRHKHTFTISDNVKLMCSHRDTNQNQREEIQAMGNVIEMGKISLVILKM